MSDDLAAAFGRRLVDLITGLTDDATTWAAKQVTAAVTPRLRTGEPELAWITQSDVEAELQRLGWSPSAISGAVDPLWRRLNALLRAVQPLPAHGGCAPAGECAGAIARIAELENTLGEVLCEFAETGHPGRESLRTAWIPVDRVEAWRAVLDRKATDAR